MSSWVQINLKEHACPTCGERFKTGGTLALKARMRARPYKCESCSALISVRVDRRGRVLIEPHAGVALKMPDGRPVPKEVQRLVDRPDTALPISAAGSPASSIFVVSLLTAPWTPELPIVWTPRGDEAERVCLRGPTAFWVSCRCPTCGKRLTSLEWGPDVDEDSSPPLGVVVLDTLLKDLDVLVARLDRRLREQRRAAALLVCRRCKSQTAFVFREPASLRPFRLDELLSSCHN